MAYFEQPLGMTAVFLLPSLKLKERRRGDTLLEDEVHAFLMENFGGYTAAAGNIFGYWTDRDKQESYGEHRQFSVALFEQTKLDDLKEFLARLSTKLGEQCIYLEAGGRATLIYATP